MRNAPALLAAAAAAAMLLSGAAMAQDQAPAGGEHHNGCMMKALQDAGLSEAQKAKVAEIRQSTQAGPARREAVVAVLTDSQRATVKASVEACKAAKQ